MLAQRVLEQNETISELKAVVSTKDASLAELRRKLEGLEEAVSMVRTREPILPAIFWSPLFRL